MVLLGYVRLSILMNPPVSPQLGTRMAGSGNDGWIYLWKNW